MSEAAPDPAAVVRVRQVGLGYRGVRALEGVDLELPAGRSLALIGPDGVGKSSLLALIAGAREVQEGQVEVLGGSMADPAHRRAVGPRIAYMPQGLGKSLYPTLSVYENLDFFGRLFGHSRPEREGRAVRLLEQTGLLPFRERAAGKLSGGMKQKLSLCCALIHDPDLLILDEPTTGVDPLSRRQFWRLIDSIRERRPQMSLLVATAYMEEAARFDRLVALDRGRMLATDTPQGLLARTGQASLDEAFIALLPEDRRQGHRAVEIPPLSLEGAAVAIEAENLTRRFGSFVAVDHVSFQIRRGEIFGFLGSNGCGKTTTMKMLTGLLPASEGQAWLFGEPVDPHDLETRRRVGYMSQSFSLYSELTVRENLVLHARLFHLPAETIPARAREMAERFELLDVLEALPNTLSLGQRQRLSLAAAMIHGPEILILDEPTSGVDPIARDRFWEILVRLARADGVTIFISTHFMNEAARCDRISLMHAGRVLVSDTPAALMAARGTDDLDEAFIGYLDETVESGEVEDTAVPTDAAAMPDHPLPVPHRARPFFDHRRLFSYARRESLELVRDPIRITMAALGSVILLFIMGYGISMDVEDLTFAVLDRDRTTTSRDYTLNIAGSRYFVERPPIEGYDDLDRRMRNGELTLALEIPPGFARNLARGRPVEIGAWIDGSMPQRAETIRGYVQGMHAHWLAQGQARQPTPVATSLVEIETRYRYNPNVESLVAIVPAVIPILLLLIPAMLTALAVVREKELGSIINFYVTPVTRLEFLLGKQLPYIVLAMANFLLLTLLAVTLFDVPLKGSFATLTLATLLYVTAATAMGLLVSSFMRSQIAALFGTVILTMVPAIQFSGMIDPVSSLEGAAALIGRIYPGAHYVTVSRGVFSKALGFADLQDSLLPLFLAVPVLIGASVLLLRKQER